SEVNVLGFQAPHRERIGIQCRGLESEWPSVLPPVQSHRFGFTDVDHGADASGNRIARSFADQREDLRGGGTDIGGHTLKVKVFWADSEWSQNPFLCGNDRLVELKRFGSLSVRLANEVVFKFWVAHDRAHDHFELLRAAECLHLPQTHARDKPTIFCANSAKSAHIKTQDVERVLEESNVAVQGKGDTADFIRGLRRVARTVTRGIVVTFKVATQKTEQRGRVRLVDIQRIVGDGVNGQLFSKAFHESVGHPGDQTKFF